MLIPVLLGLVMMAFTAYFLMLFYHVNRLEKRLSDTLQEVEIHLLNRYGEIPPKNIREVQLEEENET